jgi:hypothetical protein
MAKTGQVKRVTRTRAENPAELNPVEENPAELGVVTTKAGRVKQGRGRKAGAAKQGRSRTRQIAGIALWSIALTLVLYLLAYYLLPPPPPSAAVVSLLAFVAVMITHVGVGLVRGRRAKGSD